MGTSFETGRDISGDGARRIDLSFPLLSILSLSNNYCPLYCMDGAPLRLELQLVNTIEKFVIYNAGGSAITSGPSLITNAEIIANLMEISDEGMMKIRASAGPITQWNVYDYRNYQYNTTLTAAPTQVSVPIPAKYSSLRALYFSFRQHASGIPQFYANSSNNFGMESYTVRVGNSVIPAKAPDSNSEFFAELLRSLGTVGDINQKCGITLAAYEKIFDVAYANANDKSAAFYVGLDCESYSNTDMSNIYSGLNTSTSDIFFQPRFAGQLDVNGNATTRNITIDSYALFDSLITFENGFATVQY